MLISLKVDNCFIYNNEAEFTMRADMRCKKFTSNLAFFKNQNILKSAIVFGPNNSGKTNLVKCFKSIKDIMLNNKSILEPNLFQKKETCFMEIDFIVNEEEYTFSFVYNARTQEYIYEKFSNIEYDEYGNKKELSWFIKDIKNNIFNTNCDELNVAMKTAARNNLLIYLLDTTQFGLLEKSKNIIVNFASKIEIIDMNNIPNQKTVDIMKLSTQSKQKVVDFIVGSDLYLDDFKYLSDEEMKIQIVPMADAKAQEDVLNLPSRFLDRLHLTSIYKGVPVPSILFDSTGTKKITAIASYIIDALEKDKILIVDEIDNSLHFKLTRAIISLFNNELNSYSQLICTVHDVSLLDCKKMFRKEQIWFTHKDINNVYLYSLAEFTANKDGVRGDSDNMLDKYNQGMFGALPEPDLFNILLEVKRND